MADFASSAWFDEVNERLAAATVPSGTVTRVVFTWSDGPSSGAHALTLEAVDGRLRIAPGDHLAADAVVTLTYLDAVALAAGSLDGATALREGRLKLRGDASVLVTLWNHLSGRTAS